MAYSLWFDADQRLRIGTDHGIGVLEDGRPQQIDLIDGLIWNDTNAHAIFADPDDGTPWIGTSTGLSHLLRPEASPTAASCGAKVLQAVLGGARPERPER